MLLAILLFSFLDERDPVSFYHGRDGHPLRSLDQPGLPFIALEDFLKAMQLPFEVAEDSWHITVYNRELRVFPAEGRVQLPWKSEAVQVQLVDGVVFLRVDSLVTVFAAALGKNLIYESTTRTLHLPREEVLKLRMALESQTSGASLFFYFSDHIEAPRVVAERNRLVVRIGKPFLSVDGSAIDANDLILGYDLFQKTPDGGSELHLKISDKVLDHQVEHFTTFNTSLRILLKTSTGDELAAEQPQGERGGLRRIVLDPGHGGNDEGARGPTGLKEKVVNLEIARKLKRMLESSAGYEVTLTRNDDFHLPLKVRTGLANNLQADLFISLHVNAIQRPDAWGGETYYLALDAAGDADFTVEFENREHEEAAAGSSTGDDPAELDLLLWDLAQNEFREDSFRLARYVQQELNELAGLRNRGVKQAPLKVLQGARMPAILVEVAFISNPQEERNLKESEFKERIAQAVAKAVLTYDEDLQRRYARLEKQP
jgi:N-acetylmuramoyl-L-alanine amidase